MSIQRDCENEEEKAKFFSDYMYGFLIGFLVFRLIGAFIYEALKCLSGESVHLAILDFPTVIFIYLLPSGMRPDGIGMAGIEWSFHLIGLLVWGGMGLVTYALYFAFAAQKKK